MCKTLVLCCVATCKGISARLLLAVHATLCLWRVIGVVEHFDEPAVLSKDERVNLVVVILCLYLVLTAIEGTTTMYVKRGGEWKW